MTIRYKLSDIPDPVTVLHGKRFEFVISDELWALKPVAGGPMLILATAVKPRVRAQENGQPAEAVRRPDALGSGSEEEVHGI